MNLNRSQPGNSAHVGLWPSLTSHREEADMNCRMRLTSMILSTTVLLCATPSRAQTNSPSQREYPKEIRGYKVERATIEPKRDKAKSRDDDTSSPDGIITFGPASVAGISPLGVTLEIPIVVSPVKQKGKVDFLAFYDMTINGTHVDVDDYTQAFDLPTDKPLILQQPITVFVALPNAVVGAVQDIASPRANWPITGVVYVFGQFKRSILKFKRVVPVEIDLQMPNPLRKSQVP